jgi:hypothetical protein
MRCSNCGFPVSPSRPNCARCGTAIEGKPEKNKSQFRAAPVFSAENPGLPGPGKEAAGQQWREQPPQPAQNMEQRAFPQPGPFPHRQQSPEQSNTPFPGMNGMPTRIGEPGPSGGVVANIEQPPATPLPPAMPLKPPDTDWGAAPLPLSSADTTAFPRLPSQESRRRSAILGFGLAGVCIATGWILLIVVYILSLSLPPETKHALPTRTTIQNSGVTVVGPQPTNPVTPTPEEEITPTTSPNTFPGQKYIDRAQMASDVNPNNATPKQATTVFKPGQRIYVTFSIHSNQSGAVCLLWYLNNKNFTHYEFSIDAASIPAYSYAIASGTGNGYVEIYWASSIQCTDKLLAQQVSFTVTG